MPKGPVDDNARTDQVALMLENGYLPATTVASRVGVSLTTVKRWADDGFIDFEIIGHRRYVKIVSLIDHLGPVQAEIFGLAGSPQSRKRRKLGEKIP